MKKISLILVLVLSVALLGFTDNSGKQTQKDSFRVDPDLFYTLFSTVVIRSNWKLGFTILGIDGTVLKYGNWNFLGVGGGVAVHFKKNPGYYIDPYYGYPVYKEYDTELWPYLKLVPIKYHWDGLSRLFKVKTHLEISLTTKKEIIFGLTFSDLFKKKKT